MKSSQETILLEASGKVYFANKENEEKFKDETFKSYSEDGDFIFVYSEDDIEMIIEMVKLTYYDDYEKYKTREDRIYDSFLEEFGINKSSTHTNKDWSYFLVKLDKKTEIIARFKIDTEKIKTTIDCLFKKKDCLNEGAKVTYGYRATPPHDDMLVTIGACRKIKEGGEGLA